VLGRDLVLPSFQWLLSEEGARRFFSRCVMPDQEVRALALEEMSYRPGRECWALYRVHLAGEAQRRALVTFAEGLDEVYAHHYEGRPHLAAFLPGHGCLVEHFPADWRLPSLAGAMAGGRDVSVLRYRPHTRCVLSYVQDGEEAIGKVFSESAKAARLAETLKLLEAQGRAAGLVLPRPLGTAGGLLLMEKVAGTPLRELLEDAAHAEALVRLAAAALLKLHGFAFESPGVESSGRRTLSYKLERLYKRATPLELVAPDLAARLNGVLARLAPLIARAPTPSYTFVHGGYKPAQLLVDGNSVAVLDLDDACLGDPAMDVGNFMAVLVREALLTSQAHLRELARLFLDEYGASSTAPGVVARARLFETLYLVQRAVHSFERMPQSHAAPDSLTAGLLKEAETCLAAL
jgi:aminoglycoside phosphotransferase (APT) family kinase protein